MCTYFRKRKIKSLEKKIRYLADRRLSGQPTGAEIQKEIALHFKLADAYKKVQFNKKFPHASILMLESYRNAASLEDSNARYLFGKAMIDKGRFWTDLSKGTFSCKSHTKYAEDAYEEGLVFLTAAIEQHNSLAKRLYGLCFINGWGVEIDEKHGFELVITSIEESNSWDKATEIFTESGLNRPDFFAYMSSRRSK